MTPYVTCCMCTSALTYTYTDVYCWIDVDDMVLNSSRVRVAVR